MSSHVIERQNIFVEGLKKYVGKGFNYLKIYLKGLKPMEGKYEILGIAEHGLLTVKDEHGYEYDIRLNQIRVVCKK